MYGTVRYGINPKRLRHRTVRYGTVLESMVVYLDCTVPYGTVPYGTVPYNNGDLQYRAVPVLYCWLVGWLQLPSKEDEPRERNLRDGDVHGEVLYG